MAPRHRAPRRGLGVPPAVWAITALWAALLLGASVLWPPADGYDEISHVDMAYAYSFAPLQFYGAAGLHDANALEGVARLVPSVPPSPALDRQKTAPRGHRPSLAQLGGDTRPAGNSLDQMVQHPPLYYEAGALVLRAPGASGLSWDLQVWLLRLVSVVFMLPVPILAWLGTRRLLATARPASLAGASSGAPAGGPRLERAAVLGALLPVTIPNLVRDGASVTNDSLLILAFSVVLVGVIYVVTGDRSPKTAAIIAVATATGLLTKGFALVLPPIVVAAYLAGGRRNRAQAPLRRPLALALVGSVVGGLWWLRNLIDYGAVQPNGIGAAAKLAEYGPPQNNGTIARFVPQFSVDVVNRLWGGIGLPDSPSLGPIIVYGWFILVGIGLLAGLLGRSPIRRVGWVLAAAPVLTLLVVAEGSFSDFRRWSNYTHGSQGRYLYPAVVAVAALAAAGWYHLLQPRVRPWLGPLTLAGAVVTNFAAWLLIVHSWYATSPGVSGLMDGMHGLLRWSPLPGALTLLFVVALPVAASVAALVAVIRQGWAPGRAARRGPGVGPVPQPRLSEPALAADQ